VGLLLVLAPLLAAQVELPPAADAVVRISHSGGHGSGFLIDAKGFILTNAHIAGCPLPMVVELDAPGDDGAATTFVYRKVAVTGFHPQRDLALLRIDPAEHPRRLTTIPIRRSSPAAGEPITAIGYPGNRDGGRTLTATRGRLLVLDKVIYRREHLETDVRVWFGNSGGPLIDANGELVGVVTMKKSPADTALAVPAWEIRPELFVPLRQRPTDRILAQELTATADRALRRLGESGDPRWFSFAISCLHEASLVDVGNESHFVRLGAIYVSRNQLENAAAYLARALQINPWPDSEIAVYRDLAEVLMRQQRFEDAMAVLGEGSRKFPDRSAGWELAAKAWSERRRWEEAATAARTAHRLGAADPGRMNGILKEADREMDDDAKRRYAGFVKDLDAVLAGRRAYASEARKERRPALDEAYGRFLKGFDGVQQEGPADGLDLGRRVPAGAGAEQLTDEEVTSLFLKGQLAAAKEHLRAGKRDLARDTLKSIVDAHGEHPAAGEARALLDLIEKK
jgi:tetratricopeptide (TPR) repeat protein